MAAMNVNPKYKKQWSKLMFSFFDYLPMKYEANPREWQDLFGTSRTENAVCK